MARTMAPNSAGSQFFIMVADAPHLDGEYAAFGKVIEGMDVALAIAAQPRDYYDRPRADQKMESVTVDTLARTIRNRNGDSNLKFLVRNRLKVCFAFLQKGAGDARNLKSFQGS